MTFSFKLITKDGYARRGEIATMHGSGYPLKNRNSKYNPSFDDRLAESHEDDNKESKTNAENEKDTETIRESYKDRRESFMV